ncbi:O-acetylhomoserine aminocarboxypropyltransferase/cysteine synthase family protein [Mycoplasma sp. P36-A1]|uniref:O-acetylhomoserine aminocarboxypropyltransferase/cysteine synthase family protein n=1 Tax=Mycoplasma sp. P36-A1 TaxID=3252900 RepID=UPI003C2ECEA4
MSTKKQNLETVVVYQGFEGDDQNSIVRGIHPSTAFRFDDAQHGADLFDLQASGNIYSRLTNPTNDALGNLVAELEGGVGGLAVSSGQSALTLAVLTIAKAGDHILASKKIYGGSTSLLGYTFKNLGIETTFIDQDLPIEELNSYVKPNTKIFIGETIGNPLADVLDFDKFAKFTKDNDIVFIVDNTFATPILFRPLEHGANIVVHSATKYLGGHGNALAGIVVDGGNFDWTKSDKYSDFTKPNEGYHGLVFTDVFKNAAFIARARTLGLRDIGVAISPFNSFLILQGIQTLALRINKSSENALKVAKFLEAHPKVEWVSYPLLESSVNYDKAKKYFGDKASGILSFGVKGSVEDGKTVIENTKIAIHAVNVGDVRTIITHPASTTHRQLDDQQLKEAGISQTLIRLSVGIENADDLIADLAQALDLI